MRIQLTGRAVAFFVGTVAAVATQASATALYTLNNNTGVLSQITTGGSVTPIASGLAGADGLAIGQDGSLYVDASGGYLEKVSTSGSITPIFQNNTGEATGIAVNSVGDVYVPTNPYLDVVSPSGTVLQQITYGGIGGYGMAFNSSGDLFYDDSGDIDELTPSGTVTTFATNQTNGVPGGIACDSEGNVYAAWSFAGDIYKFTPAGTPSLFASGLTSPSFLAFDSSGDLFVSEAPVIGNGSLLEITAQGQTNTVVTGLGGDALLPIVVAVPEPPCFALAVLGSICVLLRVRPLRRRAYQHR